MQPGDTITPAGQPQPASQEPETDVQISHATPEPPSQSQVNAIPPTPVPEPSPPTPLPTPQPPVPAPLPEPSPSPTEPETDDFEQASALPEIAPLTWTASEFIEHQKPQGWYLTVGIGAIIVSIILYFIVDDVVTVVVVAIAAIMFGVVGARKPRALTYTLSTQGVQIGDKAFSYEKFKSFSVIEEGAIDSVQLFPLQRFAPPISLYFPPEQEAVITNIIGSYLPHEDRNHDPIDRLMKRLHF